MVVRRNERGRNNGGVLGGTLGMGRTRVSFDEE